MELNTYPRLAIVLVTMNNPEALRMTLKSLGNLDYPNAILINVDSSDSNICEAVVKRSHIPSKYFWEEKHGIYHAMNSALNQAKNEDIVWYLNPGDVLKDEITLDKIMEAFRKDSNLDFVYAQAQAIANNNTDNIFPKISVGHNVNNLCDGTFRISHQALLVKRSAITKEGGFDTRYQIAADLKLEFQLISNYRGKFIPGLLIEFDSQGISHNKVIWTLIESACVRYFGGYLSLKKTLIYLIKSLTFKIIHKAKKAI